MPRDPHHSPGPRRRRGRKAPRWLARLASAAGLACALACGGGLAAAPAAAARQAGPADLAVAILASTHRAHPGRWVYFTVTVTNHGPSAAAGAVITVLTRGGLVDPRLVSAPPDAVSPHWAPPRCRAKRTRLTCRYTRYEIPAAPAAGDTLTIVVKARTGRARHERAIAVVRGAEDPNPSNNRA
ncbi:MAG TPA: hypothetical protein VFA06_08805 [Actinocrinis sp.]|uniref:hypothetical protein n=1 Tax=Actinocrinis sp. TaxID=1920516 RepID=UPI002D71175B|nr:hypothetical protein [Actinocrinis sp.]HZU55953.1 hypothetical protein [Actinocrinis sp.]